MKKGTDITVVGYGDGLFTARRALELLGKNESKVELIDLVSINPIDYKTIHASVKKTGRLITVDTTNGAFSVGSEIIASVKKDSFLKLKDSPVAVSCPAVPCPTSPALSQFWYPTKVDIANAMLKMLGKPTVGLKLSFEELHLPPTLTLE